MKASIFKKCVLAGALLVPMGGVAGVGIQGVLGATQAGASGNVDCFEPSSTVTIVVGPDTVVVDLTSGTDANGDPAGCFPVDSNGNSTSDFTISDSANFTQSEDYVQSVTIPAGDIETDASTVMAFSDSGSPTSAVLGSAFPGCILNGLLNPDPLVLAGSGGSLSSSATSLGASGTVSETGTTVGGTCSTTDTSYLDGQIASGVQISGSVTVVN